MIMQRESFYVIPHMANASVTANPALCYTVTFMHFFADIPAGVCVPYLPIRISNMHSENVLISAEGYITDGWNASS